MEWVSKFTEQLYPVITSQSPQTASILQDLAGSKHRILPELNKAVSELDSRIKGINTLAQEGNFKTKFGKANFTINEIYIEILSILLKFPTKIPNQVKCKSTMRS